MELGKQYTRAGDLKAKGGSKQLSRTTEGGAEGLKEAYRGGTGELNAVVRGGGSGRLSRTSGDKRDLRLGRTQ